jgi:hypothetical protein
MDHEITTLQAWSLWLQGDIPRGFTLWGHHLFFWERLGKILEFVGALAVVIDLLGADRLSTIADELRQWRQDPATRISNIVTRPGIAFVGVALTSIVAGIAVLTGSQKIDLVLPFAGIHLPPAMAVAATILGLALATYLVLALYFVLFAMVSAPLAHFVAQFLKRQHADKWLKMVSLPVLTLGFLPDLLAS